jgi:aspartate/methionine/tyrosine aminotransferase
MHLPPFLLDQWLAAHEFSDPPIRYNLASSTGPVWTVGEVTALGDGSFRRTLDDLQLSYAPPQGSLALREQIARIYDVDPDWVVVMTGANEGLLAMFCLAAEPGASVVLPQPMFSTFATLSKAWGMNVRLYELDRENGFSQTAEHVLRAVDGSTRLVLVNTPHNPTGSVMPRKEVERLAAALADRRIPLFVDEVYHPLYFGTAIPSAVGIPNVIGLTDCSKALSIPGLRIGWIVDRDAERRERLINARMYFTISSSPLTEALAVHALRHRDELLSRATNVARTNLALLDGFMTRHGEQLAWARPEGGTVAFPWRRDGKDSRPMCEALARAGVLVSPGDCFDVPAHFRVGFGRETAGFAPALDICARVLRDTS